ncbi:MAG: hypothetical protein V4519_01360 [Patescibacteria group bacterium]
MVKKIAALSILSLALVVANVAGAQTLDTTTGATTTTQTQGTTGTGVGSDSSMTTTDASAPGLPNTGTGANAALNAALLLATGVAAVAGVAYLVRRKTV